MLKAFFLIFIGSILGAAALGTFLHFYLANKSVRSGKEAKGYGEINGIGLLALHNTGVDFSLVDARAPKFDNNKRILGALKADFSMSESELLERLPDKNRLTIIYCGGFECPAGGMLAKKLVGMGYKHVIDYPGGISEWKNLKRPS